MPYYDYVCEKCGEDFEESLPIARRDEPTENHVLLLIVVVELE